MEKSSPSNVQYGCAFFGIYIRLQLRSQVDIHLLIWKKTTTTTTKQSWWTLFMSTPHKAFIYLYINVLQWQNTNYKCIFNIVSALPEMNWSEDNRPSPSLVSILVNKFCVFAFAGKDHMWDFLNTKHTPHWEKFPAHPSSPVMSQMQCQSVIFWTFLALVDPPDVVI